MTVVCLTISWARDIWDLYYKTKTRQRLQHTRPWNAAQVTMLADMHSKLQNVGSQFGPANGWFFHKLVAASWDQKEVSRLRLGQMYFFQAFGYSWNRFANNSWGQSDGDAKDPVLFPRFKLRVWTFGWQILIAPNSFCMSLQTLLTYRPRDPKLASCDTVEWGVHPELCISSSTRDAITWHWAGDNNPQAICSSIQFASLLSPDADALPRPSSSSRCRFRFTNPMIWNGIWIYNDLVRW